MPRATVDNLRGKIVAILLCLILVGVSAAPAFSYASESKPDKPDKIRVGWYDSTFCYTDDNGRRFGYAYEYQQKIAAFTGWEYEYVEGNWPDLLQMLKEGKIDILSDVSYTDERTQQMNFSAMPMGAEAYYAFVDVADDTINVEDLKTFNGKKIGVYTDSVQEILLHKWMKANKIKAKIVSLSCSEEEAQKMLAKGEINILVATDIFKNEGDFSPVCKIGSDDFYFAVNKERGDLLNELNKAMDRIQDENRYYNEELFDRYFSAAGSGALLTSGEEEWITKHGPIKVGYRDDYLPFCEENDKTGEMVGALKDILEQAAGKVNSVDLEFQPVAYPSTYEALEALKAGEVDCAFPSGLSPTDGEKEGIMMTEPVLQAEMNAIVRKKDMLTVLPQRDMTIAIVKNTPNHVAFVENNFPEWRIMEVKDEEARLQAVEEGAADCALVTVYRTQRSQGLRNRSSLTTLSTGKSFPMAFAVQRTESDLYAILGKTAGHIPQATIEAAIEPYLYQEEQITVWAFLQEYLAAVLISITMIFLLILFLLYQRLKAEKTARERQALIAATELDPLTRLYTRGFFVEYVERMFHEDPSRKMDALAVNIEQFHTVNVLNGREFGDQVLKCLGDEIRAYMDGTDGIAGRFESDHFEIYCTHMEDYQGLFDRFQGRLDQLSTTVSIRLRMGVMPWQSGLEPMQQLDQARTACSMARESYKAHLIVFNEEIRKREIYEQRLLNDLRRALEKKEFQVYYQPKYFIQCDPPRLSSAEALIRWKHPELGMIPPGDFIPLLERHALIGRVDGFVWEEAARQIAEWKEKFGVTVPVSVNLSRLDVFDPALESTLESLVEKNGLSRKDLKLEVTESAYTESADQVIHVIESLRKKGYEIEMDDFGSGYSSLNMLSSMPVDVLKMDRAFIQDVESSEKDIRLVELVLNIARNLKVPVIAEGVETEEQVTLLRNLGCDVIQGFYFSKPLPPEEFEALI